MCYHLVGGAQIIPNSGETTVSSVPGQTPVVTINRPDQISGLSHNTYTQFNVGSEGVILDNRPVVDPSLAFPSARVILNEVTSSGAQYASQLNGIISVQGDKADVVVANPNGITCHGCGFHHTDRGVLTTGKPDIVDHALRGFSVTGGVIKIDSNGLIAYGAPQIDLISLQAVINGKISGPGTLVSGAQKGFLVPVGTLNIIAGVNKVGYDNIVDGQTQTNTSTAIDVSALGGMYAQRISLLATTAGVGVKSLGAIHAMNELLIDTTGTVLLANDTDAGDRVVVRASSVRISSQLGSNRKLEITAQAGGVDNSDGKIFAEENIVLSTPGALNNRAGWIRSASGLTINAGSIDNSNGILQDNVLGKVSIVTTGVLQNRAGVYAIAGTPEKVVVGGVIRAMQGELSIRTGQLINTGVISAGSSNLIESGFLRAGLSLEESKSIFDNAGLIQAGQLLTLDFSRDFLSGADGTGFTSVQKTGRNTGRILAESITLRNGMQFANSNTGVMSALEGQFVMDRHVSLLNEGRVSSKESMQLTLDTFVNTGLATSDEHVYIKARLGMSNAGRVSANKDVYVQAYYSDNASAVGDISNTGVFSAGRDLILAVLSTQTQEAAIKNAHGAKLEAGRSLSLGLDCGLDAFGRCIQDSWSHLDRYKSVLLDNKGEIRSRGDIWVQANTLRNGHDVSNQKKAYKYFENSTRYDYRVSGIGTFKDVKTYRHEKYDDFSAPYCFVYECNQGNRLSVPEASVIAEKTLYLRSSNINNSGGKLSADNAIDLKQLSGASWQGLFINRALVAKKESYLEKVAEWWEMRLQNIASDKPLWLLPERDYEHDKKEPAYTYNHSTEILASIGGVIQFNKKSDGAYTTIINTDITSPSQLVPPVMPSLPPPPFRGDVSPGETITKITPALGSGVSVGYVEQRTVINIKPPVNGLSHNKYTQFDVGPAGVVFLNNQTSVANLLLNEVAGPISHLEGVLEVRGTRADIIFANPNGIVCNGCGFNNVYRGIFTTGKLNVSATDTFDYLSIKGGQISIGVRGLINQENSTHTGLFAHRVLVEGDIQQATSQLEADLYKVSNTQAPVGNLSILVGAADIKNALTILTAEREAPSGWFPSGALDNLSWIDIRAGIFAQNIHLLSTTAGWVRSTGQLLAKRDAWIYARGNIDLGGTTIVGRHMNIDLRPLWWSETATFTHHAEAKLKVQEQLNIGRTCSLIYQHSCAEIRSEGTVVVKNIGSIHSELGSISVIADRFYNEALRMVPTQKSSARQREWQGMSARYITCKDATCDRWGGGYLVGTSKLYRDWRDTWHADDALLNVAPALIQAKHTLKIQADEGHNFGGILSANDIEIVSMDGSASTGKFKNEAISLYRYTYQQTGRNEYGCGWWDIACVFVNDAKIVSEHKYNADTATENIVSRHVFARVGGLITASNIVNITLADFTNKGSLYSPLSRFESEKITGSAVLVAPTGINGAQVNLDVKSLFNEGGALHAAGLLNLKVATTLKNYSGHFEGNKILIRAASIENDTLVIPYGNKENGMDAEADTARMIAKGGGIDITTSGDFSQRGGVLRSTASDITLQVGGNLRLGYTPLGFKRSEKHATGGVFEYEQSTKGVDQSELLMSRLESTQNISLTVAKNADLSGVDIVFGKKMALFARQGTLDIGDAIILAHPFQNTVAWTTELNIEARKIQMKKYIFSEQFLYSMNKLSYGFNGEVHSSMYDFVDHMYDNIDTGLVKKTMVQGGAQAHYQAAALVAGQATADTINLMMADTLGGSVGVGRTSQYANVSRVSKGHGVNFLGADKINIVTLSRAHDPVGANDINLQGVIIETLAHNGSITIQSAGRLYLGAAEGSVEENSDDDAKRLGLALQAAAHVASGGAGAGPDASYKSDRGRRVLTEKIYDNAKVLAARGSITLKSVYDFDLIGGNVWADRLSFNVGRHLNITSQQHSGADTIDKDDWGLSAGVAFNIKTGLVPMPQGGAKGGLGTSKTAYKHVLEQSGMVANHRVDGHVVGNATLTAGHIVSLSQAALSDNQIVTQPGGVLTIGGALVAHTLLDEQDSIGRYMGGGFGLAADLRPVVSLNLKEGDPDQGTVKYRATQRATISGIDVGSKAPADINRDAQHLREETQNDYIKSFDISVSVAVLSLGKTQKHTLACHRARRGTDGCGDNSALEKTPTRAEIGAMRSRLSLGNLPLVGFVRNGLGRMSAPQLGQHNADYTVRDVTEAATHFFGKTTGASPKISGYYEELDKRGFLDHPLTKANADILIAGENKVSTTGPNATLPDKVANVATPLRHTLAHVIASGAVVQNNRYNLNGEYQREHLLQQNSPFGVR